ncbi:MAG: insulinase family protein [Oligoflexia bacterium]|nr:insulinase family protein [Oligoflexia bacterium]
MKQYNKSILPNGITVISESLHYYNSVVISLWVESGSRWEKKGQEGYSHLVEHMLFKGTVNRTGKQIISEIEKLGGEINAFTTREHTCFSVSVLSRDYRKALEILCDIYLNSSIREENLELEKSVIINELLSIDDDPEELLLDKVYEYTFGSSGLGLPILGNKNSIESCSVNKLHEFYREHYKPGNMVFIASGNIVHDEIIACVAEFVKGSGNNAKSKPSGDNPVTGNSFNVLPKKLELVHCGLAFASVPFNDPRKHMEILLNSMLGEGMNSILFQEIRENRGLAYNIFSDIAFYKGVSILIIYFSCEKKDIATAAENVVHELENLCGNFIGTDKLGEYREQVKGSMKIEADNLESRMHTIAKEHFYLGRNIELSEYYRDFDSISMKDMRDFTANTINIKKANCVILGQISKKDHEKISEVLRV